MNNNIYITVLDFLQGETFEYEFIDGQDFSDELSDFYLYIESFLSGKGHIINNIHYMVNQKPITKVQIQGLEYSDYV
tara:strand:+ start:1144 stop:1374 length:231 start_codon:yes stop_codon:yes gene_type:complete